ncbi:MAG: hypothetical protein II839_02085 [Kiritimatiellae bacterium]|nr:hypothetical protein [Kiritimatiellia bacterium]
MNDNDNTTPGSVPAGETPDTSRSAVFSAIRSIFGHNASDGQPEGEPASAPGPAPAPAPAAPAEPPARVVIRNCSTRRVLAQLLERFGGDRTVSGRYFAPGETDVAKIRAWADANGLFVKESRVLDVLVLDLMMDRTKLDRPPRPYGHPRFGGGRGFRDDEGPDEF